MGCYHLYVHWFLFDGYKQGGDLLGLKTIDSYKETTFVLFVFFLFLPLFMCVWRELWHARGGQRQFRGCSLSVMWAPGIELKSSGVTQLVLLAFLFLFFVWPPILSRMRLVLQKLVSRSSGSRGIATHPDGSTVLQRTKFLVSKLTSKLLSATTRTGRHNGTTLCCHLQQPEELIPLVY